MVNLSNRHLSLAEISLLSKGLNFVPTPGEVNISELKLDLETFGRKLRLKWHFRESENDFSYNPFKKKSNFNPPKGDAAIELYLSSIEGELMTLAMKKENKKYDNLAREERDALYNLMNDTSIIIKAADKGSAIVVWDKEDYMKDAHSQLLDTQVYTKINEGGLPKMEDIVKSGLSRIRERRDISVGTMDYFLINNPRLGRFYLLPKIHKRMNKIPGRPVISNTRYYTENISEFLDFHLQPLSKKVASFVRDTNDFLRKIRDLGDLTENAILCTADVVGLYPNIPNDEGLNVLFNALEKREEKNISTETIFELANFVLKNNYFEFNDEIFYQKRGTKMAPPYAILFMDDFETRFLNTCDIKPNFI